MEFVRIAPPISFASSTNMRVQWSRLIAGTPLASPAGNKAAANNPEKRLARFKREYSQLLVCRPFHEEDYANTYFSPYGAQLGISSETFRPPRTFETVFKT
jgi:hypothetical protein